LLLESAVARASDPLRLVVVLPRRADAMAAMPLERCAAI
jgi:hypothetical protein